jgi:type IV secretory pathway VirD2 relaxase
MARFVDRPEVLNPPLEMAGGQRSAYINHAIRRHRLPSTLRQLGARGVYVPAPPATSRQAVVKCWPASPRTTGAHLRYLEHGKGADGQDAILFTDTQRPLDRARLLEATREDTHQHRLMFSVVDGERLPLPRLTEDLLRQVERDINAKLDWVAAEHHDTAHRHVHVLIRGCDARDQPVYFTKEYWTTGLRYRVMQLATSYLGPQRTPTVAKTQAVQQSMTQHMWDARSSGRLTPAQVRTRMHEAEAKIEALRARAQRRLVSHQRRRGLEVSE